MQTLQSEETLNGKTTDKTNSSSQSTRLVSQIEEIGADIGQT